MNIRTYQSKDKLKCLEVFQSNCPRYFDRSEHELFSEWLDRQNQPAPAYSNAAFNSYYVMETTNLEIIGCGGLYIDEGENEARLSWGMIHSEYHGAGHGKALYIFRRNLILKDWPGYAITLGTSQHTYKFYEKMGMRIKNIIKGGYGPELDRYDMSE